MARAKSKSIPEDLKQKILLSARQVFARKGYHGANLKEIAKGAGVANSLINYHFKNKEDLFRQTIQLFALDRMEALNRLLTLPQSREEMRVRIQMFVDEMLRSYAKDPDGFEMIHKEVKANNKIIMQLFRETLLVTFENVCEFFKKAQEKGIVDKKYDPLIIAMLLFSSTCDTAQNDHLGKQFYGVSLDDEKWRSKVVQHIVDLFMGVVK